MPYLKLTIRIRGWRSCVLTMRYSLAGYKKHIATPTPKERLMQPISYLYCKQFWKSSKLQNLQNQQNLLNGKVSYLHNRRSTTFNMFNLETENAILCWRNHKIWEFDFDNLIRQKVWNLIIWKFCFCLLKF